MTATQPDMIDRAAEARIAQQHATAAAGGFDFAKEAQLYPNGHVLYEGGAATFQQKRDAIADQPEAVAHLGRLVEAVKAQQRRDYVVGHNALRMVDGLLETEHGAFKLERDAWRKVASQVMPGGGAGYATECIDRGARKLAAFNFNFWAGHEMNASESTQLRTRRATEGEGRQVWGVVGPKYGKLDMDVIAAALAEFVAKRANGARCEWALDKDGGSIDINFANPIAATDARVGEVFHAGYRIVDNEVGQGRALLHAIVTRIRCRNVSTITSDQEAASIIHRGSTAALLASIMEGVKKADAKVAGFADAWADAGKSKIFDSDADARTKLSKLCESGYISVPGVDHAQLFNRVWAAFQKEPGNSRASLVNAVNLAAHSGAWPGASPWVTRNLEQQAGQLVYVRNFSVN